MRLSGRRRWSRAAARESGRRSRCGWPKRARTCGQLPDESRGAEEKLRADQQMGRRRGACRRTWAGRRGAAPGGRRSRAGLARHSGEQRGDREARRIFDVTEEDYRAVIEVNLTGLLLPRRVRPPPARGEGAGKVINISSVHEELPFPDFTAYCMAKGGLKMMMRNLAVELAPLGITVNNIAPGAMETPMNSKLLNDPSCSSAAGEHPAAPPGKPRTSRAWRRSWRRPMRTTSPARPSWWTADCSGTTASSERMG